MAFESRPFDLGNMLARASQLSALHAIQVRTEEVIEQIHVIDAVRAKPFTEDSTH